MSDDDAIKAWQAWHERRVATVSAPYGPLAPTGTHWLTDVLSEDPEGRIPAVPGHWRPTGGGIALTAAAKDSVQFDGSPLTGDVVLTADDGPPSVRVFDPASGTGRAFPGIEATPYAPSFALRGHFQPYGKGRTVQVENADGRAPGLGLGGELSFRFEGAEHGLQVAVDEEDGSLRAVFGDTTGLPFAVAPGERRLKGALATGIRRHHTPDSACQGHGENASARRASDCASRAAAPPRSPSPRTFTEDET
ncbi:DUF1684 domain-containing protein [Streptomyces sp. NPDC003042]